MAVKSYAKRDPAAARIQPVGGRRLEGALLALAVVLGVILGIAFGNFLLGFAAVAGFAALAWLVLELLDRASQTAPRS